MTSAIETLIVVADGGGVRAFAENQRHGSLKALADWTEAAPRSERHASTAYGGTAISRHSSARHSVSDASPAVAAERRFLTRLGARIEREAQAGLFNQLVLIAPPKALGTLRAALGKAASARIEATEPHDRIDEPVDLLRQRLRELRIPA
jgi:protein required for attachment to host cells